MDDALFQSMMANAYPSTPSLSETKSASTDAAYETKQAAINPEPTIIQSLEDGDSGTFVGGQGFRQQGLDTYETYHPGQLEDPVKGPATRRRLERQKDRYAMQYGVDRGGVQDGDIYEQGAKQGLNNLYNMTKEEGDRPWSVGDTSHYRNNELELGSAESPLDIVIGKRGDGSQGKYGRELVDIVNQDSGQSANQMGLDSFNAALYTDQGRFDRAGTAKENLNASKYAGLEGLALRNAIREDVGATDSSDGRMVSNLKSIGSGTAHILTNVMDFGAEKVANAAIALGIDDEAGMRATKDFWNKDGSIMKGFDEFVGLDESYSQNASKELMDNVKAGNYGSAAMSVLSNLDTHLAQSAPEMIALAIGAPVVAAAVIARVQDQKTDFRKKNGGSDPSTQQEIGMFATNAGVLLAEKALLVGPMKKILAGLTSKAGRSIGKSAKGVAISTAGETAQEIADQTQEQYWRKGGGKADGIDAFTEAGQMLVDGKIISGNEAISAGIAGGVMGGALRGAGETPGAIGAANDNRKAKNVKNQQVEAGKYTTDEDVEFLKTNLEIDQANVDADIDASTNTKKAIQEANTFDELENSSNEKVKTYAKTMRADATMTVAPASKEHKESIALNISDGVDANGEAFMDSKLADYGIDVKGKTREEIAQQVDNLSIETIERMAKEIPPFFSTDVAAEISTNKLLEGKFEEFKILADQMETTNIEASKIQKKNNQIAIDNFQEGVNSRGSTKDTAVDINDNASAEPTTGLGMFLSGLGIKSGTDEKLNGYSTKALSNAKQQISTELKNTTDKKKQRQLNLLASRIGKIEKKRTAANKKTGLNSKKDISVKNMNVLKGDKTGTVRVIREALMQKEIKDNRDKDSAQRLLDDSVEEGYITPKQKEVYQKRLDKISEGAIDPTQETLDNEAKQRESKKEASGQSETELDNDEKTVIEESDVNDNLNEIVKDKAEIIKKRQELEDEIGESEPTAEQKEELKDISKEENKIGNRLTRDIQRKRQFTQREMELNDRYGEMDNFFNDGDYNSNTVGIKEAFTPEQLAILNICK